MDSSPCRQTIVGESDLKQLNLHAALHVGLKLWSHLHPGFIQLLQDLQVLKSSVHLQETQPVVSFKWIYLLHNASTTSTIGEYAFSMQK